ncbi:MAG: hypothetical protein ABI451_00295 [Dokdonella sp.]
MTHKSISRLYRRLTGGPITVLDAEKIVAMADSTGRAAGAIGNDVESVSALARSSVDSDLVRLLRALKPASTMLADNIGQGLAGEGLGMSRRITAHDRSRISRRETAGRRRAAPQRWAAIAAALVAAFGIWSWQHTDAPGIAGQSITETAAKGDVIFRWSTPALAQREDAKTGSDDRMFHSDFAAGG